MSVNTTNTGGDVGSLSETSVTALFDDRASAESAVERLRTGGVPDDSIRITAGSDATADASSRGDESKGFFESLGDFFFPPEDRTAYAEGLSRGGYLVTVTGLGVTETEAALDILEDEGAVNVDEREAAWRAEGWDSTRGLGWSGETTGAPVVSDAASSDAAFASTGDEARAVDARTLGDDETIEVVEENVRVGKRDASHGRVRVRSYVREVPVREDVELTTDRVTIERRPVDRALGAGEDAFRERSIEAEERAEEVVVSKEARVVEEIALNRERESHVETVTDTVRHTEVEIDDERLETDRRVKDSTEI